MLSSTRTLAVIFRANTAEFAAQMGQIGASVKSVAAQGGAASAGLQGMAKAGVVAGGAVVAALGYAVHAAVEFEARMRDVNSIVDAGSHSAQQIQKDYDQLSKVALAASSRFGISAVDVANSLYYVASAGFTNASDASKVLDASLLAARAGLADTVTSTRAVVAVLNAYGLSANDATHVTDVLFTVVKDGVTNFQDLASSTSLYVATAAAAHIPIQDVGAALATLTRTGASASRAGTEVNAVMQAFIKPSAAMTNAAHAMGYENAFAMLQTLGLKGTIDSLRISTGGAVTSIAAFFPNIRAARGALSLMSGDGKVYANVAKDFSNQTTLAGTALRAFEIQQKSTSFQLQQTKNDLNNAAIAAGNTLLPALRAVTGWVGHLANDFTNLPGPVRTGVVALTAVLGVVTLLGSSLILLLPRIAATQAALASLAEESSVFGALQTGLGGLAGLGAAVGPLAAIVGLIYALSQAIPSMEHLPSGTELSKTFVDAGTGAKGASAEVDKLAASLAKMKEQAQPAALGLTGFQFPWSTDKAHAFGDAVKKVDATLADMVKSGHAPEAKRALTDLTDTLHKHGVQTDEVLPKLSKYKDALGQQAAANKLAKESEHDKAAAQLQGVSATDKAKMSVEQINAALAAQKEAQKAAAEETKAEAKAVQGWFDLMAPYTSQLDQITDKEKQHFETLAEKAGAGKDAWKDFADGSVVNINKYLDALERQIKAEQNWQTNLQTIAARVGPAFAQELEKLGPQAAPLIDAFAHGTTQQLQRAAGDWTLQTAIGTDDMRQKLDDFSTNAQAIMRNAGQLSADSLARYLGIGVPEVNAIAQQFGIKLEDAVNPVMVATGNAPLHAFKGGGGQVMAEGGRVAGINPGRPILWGEAGPEAYIPLSHDGRLPRSRGLASQVVSILGGVAMFAEGAIRMANGGVPAVPSFDPFGYPVKNEGVATATYAHDKVVQWLSTHAGAASGAPAPANVSGAVALGKMMAAARGWTGTNWDALYNLWMGESGWNAAAVNASSGAGGIPQALPASKMGPGWQNNPGQQIGWGLGYIGGRYGDPSHAYGAWLSRSPHWYGAGGIIGPVPAGTRRMAFGDVLGAVQGATVGPQASLLFQSVAQAAADMNVPGGTGASGIAAMQQALQTVAQLTTQENALNASLAVQTSALAAAKAASDQASAAYQAQSQVVSGLQSQLSDASQRLQDFGSAHLVGERAFSDQLFSIDQQQAAIQLKMDQLKDAQKGQPAFDPLKAFAGYDPTKISSGLVAAAQAAAAQQDPAVQLQSQLDDLSRKAEETQLQEKLQLGPLQRQLQQTADTSKELTFAEAMAGAAQARSQVELLTPQLAAAQSKLTGLGVAQDRAKAAMDSAQASYDKGKAAVDALDASVQQLTSSLQTLTQVSSQFADQQITVAPGVTIARRDLPAFSAWVNAQHHADGAIHVGSYDSGGYLPQGWTMAWNGTGRPEPVGHGAGSVMIDLSGWVIHGGAGTDAKRLAAEVASAVDDRISSRLGNLRRLIRQGKG